MPPKKPDPKDKKGGAGQLIDDDYSDLPTLPPLNEFIFSTLYAFKYKRNLQYVQQALLKHYNYPPEDPANSARFKVIQREDIVNYAKLKGYITEEESLDLSKISGGQDKLTEIFAKTTWDLIMSFTVPARRLKKDQAQPDPSAAAAQDLQVEMSIWLKDFPQTITEFKTFFGHKQTIHGVFLLEEQFSQEPEDDFTLKFQSPDPTMQRFYEEEERKRTQEKRMIEFTPEERLQAYTAAVQLGSIFKFSPPPTGAAGTPELDFRQSSVNKIKLKGAADPPTIPSTEPNPDNEEAIQREQRVCEEFAQKVRDEAESFAKDMLEYKQLKKSVKTVPLWPYPEDPLAKQREEEERQREEQRRLEEEKRQQELLLEQQKQAAAQKGKPGAALNKGAPQQQSKSQIQTISQTDQKELDEKKLADEKKKKPTSRDEEEKDWSFPNLDKILSELPQEQGGVGSILAAMVYQIEQHNKSKNTGSGGQGLNESGHDKNFILMPEEQENQLNEHFEDIFNKLAIEHNILETSFRHQFNPDEDSKAKTHPRHNQSPYQSLFNENDKVSQLSNAYTFLNGDGISSLENKTLQNCELPGINHRYGMPQQATIQEAQRESEIASILACSPLPNSQTRRALILRACEKMMKENEPERDFSFLDRNFIEKFDATTLRQQIGQALRLKPDICYKYLPSEDALLLALFFKNPPGRLLRRQWTYPVKVFPDFQVWRRFVKRDNLPLDPQNLLDIDQSKVGVIRTNSKYAFPCDNSIIRIDKYWVGGRRIGSSLVIKDNLLFGLRERPEAFKVKGGHEDAILSREAWFASDRRCDLWLEFENGAKLLIEMVEKQTAHLEEIPLHDPLPPDILAKTTSSLKVQQQQQDQPDIPSSTSPTADIASVPVGQPKTLNKNESQKSIGGAGAKGGKDSQMKQAPSTLKGGPSQTQNVPPAQQQTLTKNDSQLSIASSTAGPSPQELAIMQKRLEEEQRVLTAQSKKQFFQDNYEPTKGAKLTFTFNSGLIVQILPNGDISQTLIENPPEKKKYGGTIQDSKSANQQEKSRLITRNGQIIRYFLDGNMQIFFPDGAVTTTDKRKGVWFTVNSKGVKRVRKLKDNLVYDEPKRLKISEKVDPETNSRIHIREDGVLTIKYIDDKQMVMMPDGTEILTRKDSSGNTITFITKEHYAPVRLIFDPVKARAKTVIGLGGTDSLMGIDTIMERCNNGKVTEVLLPDKTVVQSYQERQELEGYNNFMTNMVHLVRRDDFSLVKVRQDGEVVVISANQRAYLNSIGKQRDFGKTDYDYFFEMFGIQAERRSGVFTANLDQGKLWTQDEEGNYFILFANGDSVEKLSVSFDLDQLVEGIDRKEPSSPRLTQDGEYIEEECKFLPPPKSVAHPRLFYINNESDGCCEFFNAEQLEYFFRCRHKDNGIVQSRKTIRVENEEAMSHMFLCKGGASSEKQDPYSLEEFPKIPQSVELINQTVSIPHDPVKEELHWRNIIEFRPMGDREVADFEAALQRQQAMRKRQADERERLKVTEIKSEEHREQESKIWLRIAKEKGIDISQVVGEEYKPLKEIVNEEKRQKFLDELDKYFSDDELEQAETLGSPA